MIGTLIAPDPAADVLPPLPPFPGARRGHHGGGWLKDWRPGQSGNPSGHNAEDRDAPTGAIPGRDGGR